MTTTDSNAPQNVESFPIQLIKSVQHTPYDYLDLHNIIRSRREQLEICCLLTNLPPSYWAYHITENILIHLQMTILLYPQTPGRKCILLEIKWPHSTHSNNWVACQERYPQNLFNLLHFLDYPTNITSGDSLPNYYAEETDLPDGYHHLIQGLHLMDSFQFEMGLIHLSQPSVIPTYPEQVVSAFVKSQTKRIRRNSPTKSIQDSKAFIPVLKIIPILLLLPFLLKLYQ